MKRSVFYGFVALFFLGLDLTKLSAQSNHDISSAQVDQWMQDLSNWGRWGANDELGTLNLITNEKRIEATQLVRSGVSVSLAQITQLIALSMIHCLSIK